MTCLSICSAWCPFVWCGSTHIFVRKLETFHRCCIRCIMGIGRTVQWAEHITTIQLAERFGMHESVSILLSLRRLRWLGHVACMPDDRIPKQILFRWLPRAWPVHGVKLRWWDKVRQELKNFLINDCLWYVPAGSRSRLMEAIKEEWRVCWLHHILNLTYFTVRPAKGLLEEARI